MPKKLGLEATSKNLNDLKLQKQNDEKVAQEKLDAAKALAEEIKEKSITVKIQAGVEGRVFGSISSKEIALEAKKQLNMDIDKKKIIILMPLNHLELTMLTLSYTRMLWLLWP